MKPFLFALFISVLLAGCKKDKKIVPEEQTNIDAVGDYALSLSYSYQLSGGTTLSYSITDFPCLANNVSTLRADGTSIGRYVGTDTCYVVKPAPPYTFSQSIGQFGNLPAIGTYTKHGNELVFLIRYGDGPIKKSYATLSKSGEKIQLTYRDTISFSQNNSKTVYVSVVTKK